MKYLVTGGCSFSHHWEPCIEKGWIELLHEKLQEKYPDIEAIHTGHNGQGQEMIQKKVSRAIMNLINQGIHGNDIIVVVMWSGTFRKSWYIENEMIIQQIVDGMVHFNGGMDPICLDLDNSVGDNPKYFKTAAGGTFPYNPNGGWYSTVNGSDCQLPFVQQHYILDGWQGSGIGKVHYSLENMIMLQNFCRWHNVTLINQFFMDHVYNDIVENQSHQLIEYLFWQFNRDNTITEGMFETLHELLNVPRNQVYSITHEKRKELNGNKNYFNKDGFHPGEEGSRYWCNKLLFPFMMSKGLI